MLTLLRSLPSAHPFCSQGEKEAAAGIPVTPPCDASKVCMPAAQLFFIERFMAPTLEAFKGSAPAFYAMAAAWLADTQVGAVGCAGQGAGGGGLSQPLSVQILLTCPMNGTHACVHGQPVR